VECWTQKYVTSIGLGASYGHSFKEVMLEELLCFDSVVIRDGVHGGTEDRRKMATAPLLVATSQNFAAEQTTKSILPIFVA
jgi:hypothetical protein